MSENWKEKAERYRAKVVNFAEEKREEIRAGMDTIECWGGAGTMGYIHGRYGGMPKRWGIPLDMGVTALLKAFAFGGWFGTKSVAADLHSVGNGTGSWVVGTLALDAGQKALRAAKNKDGSPEALNKPRNTPELLDGFDNRANTIMAGESAVRRGARNENLDRQIFRF